MYKNKQDGVLLTTLFIFLALRVTSYILMDYIHEYIAHIDWYPVQATRQTYNATVYNKQRFHNLLLGLLYFAKRNKTKRNENGGTLRRKRISSKP